MVGNGISEPSTASRVSVTLLPGEAHRDSLTSAQDFAEARMENTCGLLVGLWVHEWMI